MKYKKPEKKLSPAARSKLEQYPWPGNVRELQHAAERALIMNEDSTLRPEDFLLSAADPKVEGDTGFCQLQPGRGGKAGDRHGTAAVQGQRQPGGAGTGADSHLPSTAAWRSMVYRRFRIQCVGRIVFLGASLCLFFYVLLEGSSVAALVAGLFAVYQIYALIRYVETTNRDLSRFFETIKYSDFSQTFAGAGPGSSLRRIAPYLQRGPGRFPPHPRRKRGAFPLPADRGAARGRRPRRLPPGRRGGPDQHRGPASSGKWAR